MGTRNLSLLKSEGKIVIAQYGQWDGYPSGQGATILDFCKNKSNLNKLKACLVDIRNLDELMEFVKAFNYQTTSVQGRYYFDKLCHRDIGGEIFENIISLDRACLPPEMNGNIYVQHYSDLAETKNYSDVWIEYAYLINLDTNELECYGYGKNLKNFNLDNLPTREDFIKELEEK